MKALTIEVRYGNMKLKVFSLEIRAEVELHRNLKGEEYFKSEITIELGVDLRHFRDLMIHHDRKESEELTIKIGDVTELKDLYIYAIEQPSLFEKEFHVILKSKHLMDVRLG